MLTYRLERPQPTEAQATSSGTLTRVVATGETFQHFVSLSPREQYRFEVAFYDRTKRLWWARHPKYPKVALIVWEGQPPEKIPRSVVLACGA